MNTKDIFDLPAFDIPQKELPESVSYEAAIAALEELSREMRIRKESPSQEEIPFFEL